MANLTNLNNKFLVQTGGNVGIGSTSPTSPLVVVGTGVGSSGTIGIQGANAHVGFKNSSGTFRSWVGHFNAAVHGSDADLNLKTGYGSVGNIRFTADGDTTAAQMFLQGSTGNLGIGTTSPTAKLKVIGANDAWTCQIENTQALPYGLSVNTIGTAGTTFNSAFYTHSGTGMYIVNNGRVGIGTTSPSEKLEVAGSIRLNSELQIFTGTTDIGQISNSSGALNIQGTSTRDVSLGSDTTPQAVFIEGTNGRVGIGTTSPDRSLDVEGTGMAIFGTGDYTELMLRGQVEGTGTVRNVGSWHWSLRPDVGGDNDDLKLLRFVTGSYAGIAMQVQNSTGDIFFGNTVVNPASGFSNQRGFGYDNSTGNVEIAATSGNALTVGRNESSDGAIMTLRKESNIKHSFGSTTSYLLGNVGIGTTSPTSPTGVARFLEISGATAGIVLHDSDVEAWDLYASGGKLGTRYNNGANGWWLDSSGHMGIGITGPSDYDADADNLVLGATSGNTGITIVSGSSASNFGSIYFADGTSSTAAKAGYIRYEQNTSKMTFGINAVEKVAIDLSGNVGIGTTTPNEKLVVGTTSGTQNIEIGNSYIQSFNRSGSAGYQTLNFYASSYAFNVGNVGVGTTSPGTKLDINSGISSSSINAIQISQNTTGIIKPASAFGVAIQNGGQNTNAADLFISTASGGSLAERMRITSAGHLCVGGTAIQAVGAITFDKGGNGFTITNNTTSGAGNGHEFQVFRRNSTQIGSIVMNGTTGVTYSTSSDYRLKEDLQDFAGLDMVSKIPVYDFKWKADKNRSYGVMAHELQKVLPQAVTGEKDAEKMQEVDYSKIVPLLVGAIQELKQEIELLKSNGDII